MATKNDVKKYLASWFQLGKGVVIAKDGRRLLPHPIFRGDNYSPAFLECWQTVASSESGDCYLEGTAIAIRELIDSPWEIVSCARCEMPIPIKNFSTSELTCTCSDLENWPNAELPPPRSQMDSLGKLQEISDNLRRAKS